MKKLNELYEEWNRLGSNKLNDISLPNYFLTLDSSIDLSNIQKEIMMNLDKNNLVKYSNDIKSTLYDFSKENKGSYFSLMKFFYFYKNNLSRFNIPYKGVLFINLSSWINYEDEEELTAFIKFISSINEGMLIFFIVKKENYEKIFNLISKTLWIEGVSIQIDKVQEGVNYLNKLINSKNFKLDIKDQSSLTNIVNNIIKNNENNMFKALNTVFNKIIYKKIKEGGERLKIINDIDLVEYQGKSKESKDIFRMF